MTTNRFRSRGTYTLKAKSVPWQSYDAEINACTAGQSFAWANRTAVSTGDWVGDRQTMTDVVTAGFKRKQSAGTIIMNPMTSQKVVINEAIVSGSLDFLGNYWQCGSSSPYRYQSRYTFDGNTLLSALNVGFEPNIVANHWGISSLFTTSELENMIDEASTKCHNARGRSDFNIWETLAERRESYRLLSSYLKSAARAAKSLEVRATSLPKGKLINGRFYAFRPRKSRSGYGSAENLTQAGLEAHLITEYGLKPLLSDVKGVMAGLGKSTGDVRRTIRGTVSDGRSKSTTAQVDLIPSHVAAQRVSLTTEEIMVRAMSLDEWRVTSLENVGFSAKGLITLPWELITLSFVVDSFVNVGDYLGALVPTPGVTQLGACIVYSHTRSLTNTISGASPVGIAVVNSAPIGVKTGVEKLVVRVPGLRVPSLVIRSDFGLDPEIERNRQRIVNYSALTVQRLISARRAISRLFS